MIKIRPLIAIAVTLLLALSSQSFALYKWTDETGQVHLSDQPNPNSPANSESIPDQSHKPSSNRPITAAPPQYPFSPAQPLNITPPANIQIPSTIDPVPQPPVINPPPYDNRAAERALDQALLPVSRLVAWMVLIGLVHLLLFMMTLVNIMKSEFKNNTNKILWVIIILALPYLGVLLYVLIGRQQRVDHEEGETSFRYTKYRDIGRE